LLYPRFIKPPYTRGFFGKEEIMEQLVLYRTRARSLRQFADVEEKPERKEELLELAKEYEELSKKYLPH
jgi:hypothetical protein